MSKLCSYYQARVRLATCWFISGVFRNEDHWVFDRTTDDDRTIMEFFVAPAYEDAFLARMHYLTCEGYIESYSKLPNPCQQEPA